MLDYVGSILPNEFAHFFLNPSRSVFPGRLCHSPAFSLPLSWPLALLHLDADAPQADIIMVTSKMLSLWSVPLSAPQSNNLSSATTTTSFFVLVKGKHHRSPKYCSPYASTFMSLTHMVIRLSMFYSIYSIKVGEGLNQRKDTTHGERTLKFPWYKITYRLNYPII